MHNTYVFNTPSSPKKNIQHYNLYKKIDNGYIYAKMKRAWYGRKETGKIAHDNLVDNLKMIQVHQNQYTKTFQTHYQEHQFYTCS